MSKRFTLAIFFVISLMGNFIGNLSPASSKEIPRSADNLLTSGNAITFSIRSPAAEVSQKSDLEFLTQKKVTMEISSPHTSVNELNWFASTPAGKILSANPQHALHIPTSYRDAVLTGDAPIEMIQDLHQRSYAYWHSQEIVKKIKINLLAALKNYVNFKSNPAGANDLFHIDIKTLASYNQEAYFLWNELVKCNHGNTANARTRFLMPSEGVFKICDEDSEDSREEASAKVLEKIRRLAKNFQAYYKSIDLDWINSLSDPNLQPVYLTLFRNIHPMLTQFLILQRGRIEYTYADTRIPHELTLLNRAIGINYHHLFIDGRLNQNANKYAKPVDQDDADEITLLDWYLNSTAILSLLNFENFEYSCGIYGFWPLLNRSLLYADFSVINHAEDTPFKDLSLSIQKNCGTSTAWHHKLEDFTAEEGPQGPFYNTAWLAHRAYMNDLYYALIGTQWDTRTDTEKTIDDTKAKLQPVADTLEPVVHFGGRLIHALPVVGEVLRLLNY